MRRPVRAACLERLPELRHVDTDDLLGRFRRLLTPELVDDPIDGDHLVPMQEQEGEKRTRPRAAERDGTAILGDLERAQQPELHMRFYHAGAGASAI